MSPLSIHSDIQKASTLPASFYRDPQVFERSKEAIFASTWQYVADASMVAEPAQYHPFTLLEGVLDEPLLFTRDRENNIHCLSNVCTHRGKLVAEGPGQKRMLSCGYHGRCFNLDGTFRSMPEFEGVEGFPGEADHLAKVNFASFFNLLFVGLDPKAPMEEMLKPILDRVGWMPLDTLAFDAASSKDYYVNANWALYCDNFLEGFHIPFVHPGLNNAVEFDQYTYELFPYCNLQLAIAKEDEPHFDIPEGEMYFGQKVYAYYFFLFPNLMFNFYPWGLSLNVVEPLSYNQTRIRFRTYYFADNDKDRKLNRIDLTEMEDEEVVESVQKGIQSRFYKSGRFSPNMEPAVHHFHRLVADFYN